MKKLNIFILVLLAILFSCKKEKTTIQKTAPSTVNEQIDDYLKAQQNIHEIPGFAVAVIKNNETIYKGYFGIENLETQKNIDSKTIFPVFSVTKLITATAIFKLIEDEKLQLEDTIDIYINDLPEAWQNITVQHLLTHSSGLPDFILREGELTNAEMLSEIKKLPLLFEKGDRFRYNQTNYWFLAKIIKRITNSSFHDHVLENQFANSKDVFITSNFKDKIENRVLNYDYNSESNRYETSAPNAGERGHAANGLSITLDDFILWNKEFDKNSFINQTTKEQMWQPFNYKNPDDEFLHGWGVYEVNNTDSYGFTGGLKTGFRKFIKNDLTIIYLSNGFKYYPVHNTIINHIAGMVDVDLLDKSSLASEKLANIFLNESTEKAIISYQKIRDENPEANFEDALNRIGYVLMRRNELEKAINVFKVNAQEYPTSGNVFDSLAEGYYMMKDYNLSKENYQKSLALEPQNENAKMMLQKLEKLITKK